MKRNLVNTVIQLIIILLTVGSAAAQMKDGKVRRVVLDAGHGGKDPGAVGSASREKDITLSIALKAGKYISDNFPDVEVIYTRKTDVAVELDKRAKIANEAHADLFISIHCNSSKSKTPYGTETFVMGIHKSAANLEVAKLENAAILLEDNYSERYEGFDPRSPESHIIFSLFQNSYREFSLELASLIQEQFRVKTARFDRGVKEAGFWVLYRTAMPGVLVEAGFISNQAEEQYLRSATGQMEVAATIFRAFRHYKANVEKGSSSTAGEVAPAGNELAVDQEVGRTEQESATTVDGADGRQVSEAQPSGTILPGKSASDNQPPAGKTGWLVPDLVFRIQIAASATPLPLSDQRFRGLTDIYTYEHAAMYKYTAGAFDTRQKAEVFRKELKRLGFADAFVVVLYQERRISNEQAEVLVNAALQAKSP